MNNAVMEEVLASFAEKQEKNRQEEDRRLKTIRELHPDLAKLMQQRHDMVMASVRGAFSGNAAQDPEQKMLLYNQEIKRLLESKGYPADYLSPICDCVQCGDTGYIYKGVTREMCDCLKKAYLSAISRQGEPENADKTFDCFDETRFPEDPLPGTDVTQRQYMRIIRDKCLNYADQIPGGAIRNLLLHGGSGLGKTYLLHCVENQARKKGLDVLYITAYDLLTALKNAYFSRNGETADEYLNAQLLLVDDLGMEPLMENITVEQMYYLLNARLAKGLYTAVSTNLSRTELQKRYTERVSSRLLDTRTSLALPFLGKDIRLMK